MSGGVIFRHAEAVMGTVVSLDVRPKGLAYDRTREAIAQACAVLHRADEVFSLYRPDSPLSQLRRREITLARCPAEVGEVLDLCAEARERSGGWFDPWALPGGLDPTGLVKGWAAREAAAVLRQSGISGGMVNAAGDIAVFGQPEPDRDWQVGVCAPTTPGQLLCSFSITDAVATSGSYERGDHVRDPHTGAPAAGAISATVCGPDLALADAFATGLLAGGQAGLHEVTDAGYEALLVLAEGSTRQTTGFPAIAAAANRA